MSQPAGVMARGSRLIELLPTLHTEQGLSATLSHTSSSFYIYNCDYSFFLTSTAAVEAVLRCRTDGGTRTGSSGPGLKTTLKVSLSQSRTGQTLNCSLRSGETQPTL